MNLKLFPMVIVTSVITSIVVSFLTYFFTKKFDNREKYKTQSLLGAECLTIIMTEICNGYIHLKKTIDLKNQPSTLPDSCWCGISTISDEILLRIFEVTKDTYFNKDDFPANDIRIHCNIYFSNIVKTYAELINEVKSNPKSDIELIQNKMNEMAKNTDSILRVLNKIRTLLKKNANKTFPK